MLRNFLKKKVFSFSVRGGLGNPPKLVNSNLEKKLLNFFFQICFFATYMQCRHEKQQSCKIWGLYSKNWLRYGHRLNRTNIYTDHANWPPGRGNGILYNSYSCCGCQYLSIESSFMLLRLFLVKLEVLLHKVGHRKVTPTLKTS